MPVKRRVDVLQMRYLTYKAFEIPATPGADN